MTALGLLTRYGLSAPGGTPPPGPGLPSDPDGIWLETLFISGLSNNDDVTVLEDASAAGYDLNSDATHPIFHTNATPAGAPVVRAAGASRMAGSGAFYTDNTAPYTAFIVAATDSAQTYRLLASMRRNNNLWSIWYPRAAGQVALTNIPTLNFGTGLADGAFRVFTLWFDPDAHPDLPNVRTAGYVGKSRVAADGGATTPHGSTNPLQLFGEEATTSRRFIGDWCAFLWYREALNDSDREAVVDYLTERYITPTP